MSRRKKEPQSEVMTADAFSNPLFRLGFGSQAPVEATSYPLTRMTDNYALLNSLYRDNWVVQNVVSLVPEDMVREWYTLQGISPEHLEALEKVERQTKTRARILEGLRWGRLYGGAAGLIMIDGQEGILEKPLDLSTIYPGSFQGLYVLDRWQGVVPGTELVFEGGEPNPMYYSITDAKGNTVAKVHHSRLVRFTGRDLPYLERVAEIYWGESEVEALYKDVVAHDNVSANITNLTFQANINTMEVKNLSQLLSMASPEVQRRFWMTMQAQSVMKSNFGMQLVEEGQKVTNNQYSFAGLKDVYETMCLNLCGASHIPMTKLFGRSPAGMNATGESDLQNYYDYVDAQREAKLRPVLEKLLPVLCMSAWGVVPDDLQITFPPLWTPTATELATIAKTKAEAVVSAYQAGLMNVDTTQKELKKLEDETGLFGSITDDEIAANAGRTYQDATSLRDPLAGLGYEEGSAPFEGAVQDAELQDYSPNQPRDKYGRWTSGGAGAFSGGHREEDGYDLTDDEKAKLVQKDTGMGEEEAREVVAAINDYTLEGYSEIRSAQAAGEYGEYRDKADAIERYIEAAPKFGEGDLYRGMSVPNDFAESIKVGDVIDNGGAVSSWTSNETVAENFAVPEMWGGKSAVMVVEGGTQKGTSIKHLSANGRDEDEVLIPSSAKYEITDIFDGDTVYVYLKEVP